MAVARLLPTPEVYDLLELMADFADRELRPLVDAHERSHRCPEAYERLADLILHGIAQPER